jgi:hypothetical protein
MMANDTGQHPSLYIAVKNLFIENRPLALT